LIVQFDMNSLVNLYDSDIDRIQRGPLAWMRSQEGKHMDLEDFRKTAVAKFADIGLRTNVKCYETNVSDVYAFEAEIQERLEKRDFDYDRQIHEVVNNYLELPGEEKGFIKTSEGMENALNKHGHGHKH
jgi:hypothetical protein